MNAQNDECKYYWSRINLPISVSIFLVLIACFVGLIITRNFMLYGIVFFLLFVILLFIYALTIEVDRHCLYIRYGVGLFEKTINLSDIQNTQIVPNSEYPICVIYNMGATNALKVNLRNGLNHVIPVNDVRKLQNALSVKGIR